MYSELPSGPDASKSFSVTINSAPTVTMTGLPQGTKGVAYPGSGVLTNSGGTSSFTWTLTSGSLPSGMSISGNSLTGTPTVSVTNLPLTFQVQDAAGATASKSVNLTINPPPSITTGLTLPGATENSAYGPVNLTSSGGTGPFNWTMPGGTLPSGVSFTGGSSGSFQGTPAGGSAGSYSPQITLTDSLGASTSVTFSLTVTNGPKVSTANPGSTSPTVNPDTNLVLTFNMAMKKSEVQANFSLSPASVSAVHTYVWDTPASSTTGTILTVVFDTAAPFGQITADDLLADNTTYTWTIVAGAHSGSGLVMPLQTGQFKTILDTTTPQVASIQSNGSQNPLTQVLTGSVTGLTITFNEAMDTSTTNSTANVNLQGAGDQRNASAPTTSGTMTVQWTNSTTLAIGFNPALLANTGYQLRVDSLHDLDNNYINNAQYNILTAGSGTAAPFVTGTFPANGATGVNRDTGLFIATSEDLSPDVQTRVQITGATTPFSVNYQVGKNNGPQGIQIYPQTAWPASTAITVTIPGGAGGVTNSSLVPFASNVSFTFTTGATGASSGAITINDPYSIIKNGMVDCYTYSPLQGTVAFKDGSGNPVYFNVSTLNNAAISVTDPNGIPVKNIQVNNFSNGGGGRGDPGSEFFLSNRNGQGVTSLAQNTTYTLTFNGSIQSSTGGSFTPVSYTFTTVANSNTLPRPQLDGGNDSRSQTSSGPPNPSRTWDLRVSANNSNGNNLQTVANASGGTTAYTVSNSPPGWMVAGASVGIFGCNNNQNNGIFTVASVTGSGPFTLTLNNASGVAETPPNNAFAGAPITVTATDITGGTNTFTSGLTYNGNNNGFEYKTQTGNETTVTTSGVHVLQFTVADGVAGHTLTYNQNFYFFSATDMSAMAPSAPSGAGPFGSTPTYTWTGSLPASALAMLVSVQDPNNNQWMWVMPPSPASFTQPANTPLPVLGAGQQYSWTIGYFHSVDGTIRDNGSEGVITPPLKFTR